MVQSFTIYDSLGLRKNFKSRDEYTNPIAKKRVTEESASVPKEDVSLSNDPETTLSVLMQTAVSLKLPIALWRYPHDRTPQAIVDLSGHAKPVNLDFRAERPGFVISPFVDAKIVGNYQNGCSGKKGEENQTLFLDADIHLCNGKLSSYIQNGREAAAVAAAQDSDLRAFLERFNQIEEEGHLHNVGWFEPLSGRERTNAYNEAEYCTLVQTAIDFIQKTDLDKIVISRFLETELPAGFGPIHAFQQLCRRYPHALVSLVAIPNIGTWIGASPELLLSIQPDLVRTMALAGTQENPHDGALTDIEWGAKEQEEQALVSDYIRGFFEKANVETVYEEGPRTVSAGNVVHLQTDFSIPFAQTPLEQKRKSMLANQVLHELHPTSAVCGMPKEKALSFILDHEGYNRSFYSGFLGPVHIDGYTNLFVNLRCMQLGKAKANIYVGGGITGDSDPEAEWDETVLKSQTLLPVLHGES